MLVSFELPAGLNSTLLLLIGTWVGVVVGLDDDVGTGLNREMNLGLGVGVSIATGLSTGEELIGFWISIGGESTNIEIWGSSIVFFDNSWAASARAYFTLFIDCNTRSGARLEFLITPGSSGPAPENDENAIGNTKSGNKIEMWCMLHYEIAIL